MLDTGAATSSVKSVVPRPTGICTEQVAVGAQRLERQLAEVAAVRRLGLVDETEEDLGAHVARTRPAALLRRRVERAARAAS